MRTTKEFLLTNPAEFKLKLLSWSKQFEEVVWLDSNDYPQKYTGFEAVLAVEAFTSIKTDSFNAFDNLKEYQEITADWIFGYLSYDLKNDVEELSSNNFDGLQFPELYFFQPAKMIQIKNGKAVFHYLKMVDEEMEEDFFDILGIGKESEESGERKEESGESSEVREERREEREATREEREESREKREERTPNQKLETSNLEPETSNLKPGILNQKPETSNLKPETLNFEPETSNLKPETLNQKPLPRISKEDYLKKVKTILHHIHRGDIYEANFCQEFYAEETEIDALEVFKKLNAISVSPFAVFLKFDKNYLLSASPERYLRKDGSKIFSQPIKGTARRSEDPLEDKEISKVLSNDPKERSENIMIVDLVRNDLSKVAKRGTVQVEELCEVYSFRQVHQLISTVSAELDIGIPPVEVLRATFPMGSMTGAPKISAMKIIEEMEETRRGLYSGAVGYFTPQGNFDFNVVIRSILYNAENKYISFSVGGAITSGSVPEREYEECLLKAKAMREVLGDF
ncbi:anthranilate synthase component I family protein [Antarcticibacterium sp. 1MA-6-2]|uniref:chorismate-binding protein n=1 Tax=Antarcticibacterium sp. 1MA-6-2 TaxID=2908210 RepID=UPI001F1FF433|nr:chorismate-binding protein [Antarcticibacterium sp. 1MA-6-2]UJH92209.1 anthranilate synthase component I family protein [Antarcticibacterium sp. 1MA-6-2]